jgi:Fusaric acid resistance protein-like
VCALLSSFIYFCLYAIISYQRYRLTHTGPRAAILHRTSLLTELICSLDAVINTEKDNTAFKVTYLSSLLSFSLRAVLTIFTYFKEVFKVCAENLVYFSTIVIPVLLACSKPQSDLRTLSNDSTLPNTTSSISDGEETRNGVVVKELSLKVLDQANIKPSKTIKSGASLERAEVIFQIKKSLLEVRNTYSQPAKIALAVTVTSLFALLQQLSDSSQNSLWAILVVILVRQENTSSSFLTGYQRLEGTVVGAVYAFTMFQIFGCANSKCGTEISTPVLVIWLAICSFFRDGPRHGYAAIVAGITPIVLFLGNTPSTADGAWMRVEMTFIGIGIYLLIDNLILPNRTDVALRAGVLKSIEETRYRTYPLPLCDMI